MEIEREWNKMVMSLAMAHVPESWKLLTFMEAKKGFDRAKRERDPVLALVQLHLDAKFYPDLHFVDSLLRWLLGSTRLYSHPQ